MYGHSLAVQRKVEEWARRLRQQLDDRPYDPDRDPALASADATRDVRASHAQQESRATTRM